MIKSMTGFSRNELSEQGITVNVEIKSVNGRYLEPSIRLPRNLQYLETELREILKKSIERGTVQLNVNLELEKQESPFALDEDAAKHTFDVLQSLRSHLKLREVVKMEHLLQFSSNFISKNEIEDEKLQENLIKKTVREALRLLDNMRKREGTNIAKDIKKRINFISKTVEEIEQKGYERIPQEREKLRQKIAQLFENDEIDEQRLQMEIVLMADKLDISEECVRLKSHFKFFDEAMKGNESAGRKINFLLQEMHREINTIGSKANNADISQLVVIVKEELERIREQIQNIE